VSPIGKRHTVFILCCFSIVALVLRLAVAWRNGIWADEGFFLLVIESPSWSSMISFLRLHESHPPLFYAVMRVWSSFVTGDRGLVLLPVLLGVTMIPALYWVGNALFSRKVGIAAAALASISPALIENSTQLRPYGLLPLTALFSSYFLVTAIDTGELRKWTGYVVATLAMLYTHNWGWLVAGGQFVSVVFLSIRFPELRRSWIAFALSLVAIALAFLPWASAFLFQVQHAGHGGIPVDGIADRLIIILYGALTVFQIVFPARFASPVVLASATLGIAFAAMFMRSHIANWLAFRFSPRIDSRRKRSEWMFGVITASALIAAIVLSTRSNLLIPRCLVTLLPVGLLLFTSWVERVWAGVSRSAISAQLGTALPALMMTTWVFDIGAIVTTPTSSAREVASGVQRDVRPTDLLIIAPEWYAPSFNHYFNADADEIIFPSMTRSSPVDFAHVWDRTIDPRPLSMMQARIRTAGADGRRIWLVVSADTTLLREEDLARAYRHKLPKPVSILRRNQIRSFLEGIYGQPRKVVVRSGRPPTQEDLRAYLYVPVDSTTRR
jgi:4-amino-4-deoxy-L-arabinose transferase-like glycosyltransferase